MSGWTKLFLTLTIIGAINWGLVGFFNFDLIAAIFGNSARHDVSLVSRIIFALVGLCGVGLAAVLPKLRETAYERRRTTVDRRTDVPA